MTLGVCAYLESALTWSLRLPGVFAYLPISSLNSKISIPGQTPEILSPKHHSRYITQPFVSNANYQFHLVISVSLSFL